MLQFGNNWMKNILEDCQNWTRLQPSPIWQSEEYFEFNSFQIGQDDVAKIFLCSLVWDFGLTY